MPLAEISSVVPINACETVSGKYVDVVFPQPSTILITDIAWSLARQARFAGHTLSEEIWNVAQHSLFVLDLITFALSEEGYQLHDSLNEWLMSRGFERDEFRSAAGDLRLCLGALLHDATETYLVDLPSPAKRHPALRTPYKELEHGLKLAIDESLKLEPMEPLFEHIIVWADLLALQIEAANLMPSRGKNWNGALPKIELAGIELFPQVMPWRQAYDEFLNTFWKTWWAYHQIAP